MSKERDIEILNYKIADATEKINNFKKYKIPENKIAKMEALKEKYEAQLSEIQNS